MLRPVTARTADVLNLSFCGCGFLGIYHLGVANCLVKHGQTLLSRVHRVGGASAGSLIAAAIVCARDKIQECIQFCYNLSREVNSKPLGALTPGYSIMDPLKLFLQEYLPPDAHEQATGKLHISMTTARKKKNVIQSEFASRDELINCLLASSYIPVYGGFRPPVIRGHHFYDGGITDNLPGFADGLTIYVSPFSGKQTISPTDKAGRNWYLGWGSQDFQVNRNNAVRVIHALFPPSKSLLKAYYERGIKDAKAFLRRECCFEENNAEFPPSNLGSTENILNETIRDQVRRLSLPTNQIQRVSSTCAVETSPTGTADDDADGANNDIKDKVKQPVTKHTSIDNTRY
ncbi:patatin-like phospholipase domain-containing protein 4 [Tubulanus polymorphus]|uniref:patatin-like phospholipase domain-containing protein 4 n=1 Tax=Tubulanus polymorphus TaxID=672921 RepID=UPI003DA2EB02